MTTNETQKCDCGQPATHALLGLDARNVCATCYAATMGEAPARPEPQYYLGDPPVQVDYDAWRRAGNA
jgi:hypothetical protein